MTHDESQNIRLNAFSQEEIMSDLSHEAHGILFNLISDKNTDMIKRDIEFYD